MTEAVNRSRIPQLRYAPAERQGVHRMARDVALALDLPNRKASTFTASHFWLDDYPNASEPLSDAPTPHTTLNPAAAFETADEGYEGVPFPRPPREFTRPSFLPDSDDGGTDPGQALRNDGLNPPRPPTLGGRKGERHSGREAIVAGGAAGAAAAVRSVSENQTMLALRGGGDWLDRTLRIPRRPPGLAPPTERSACAAKHRTALGSGAPAAEGGAAGGGGGVRGGAGHRELRFAAARGSGSIGRFRHCCGGSGGSSGSGNRRQRPVREPWRCWAREPWQRRARWVLRLAALPSREQVLPSSDLGYRRGAQCGFASDGLGRCNRRRHGQRRLATERDNGRADAEWDARVGSRGPLLHPGAAEGPAEPAGGLQDRHGVGERAQESASAADPKPSGTAPEAPGADALRAEQRSHSRVLGQRTVPGQPPVPRRPGTPRNPAVLRRPSSGERTGSCIR